MASSSSLPSKAYNESVEMYIPQTLLHAGLNENVSVLVQLSFILIVTVFVLIFEYGIHRIERVIERHPTFWTLLNKMYRELLVGGLTAFVSKRIDQWDSLSQYDQMKLNNGDELVLYFSLSISIQSAIMFIMLRRRNAKVDKLSTLTSKELLEYFQNGEMDVNSQLASSILKLKILQQFFLNTFQLPELFSFSKYLRAIQDSEIFSLFDVEIIEWLLLVAVYVFFFSFADLLEFTGFIPEGSTEETIQIGVSLSEAKHIISIRLAVMLAFLMVLTLTLVILYIYIRKQVHHIVVHAGYGHNSYLDALQAIVSQEYERTINPISNDEAISIMEDIAESLSDVEDHSRIWDLIQSGIRRIMGKQHVKINALPIQSLKLRFFSRKAVHVFTKIMLSFNAMYFALIWATLNASIAPVIATKEALWYPFCLLGIMGILVFNMVFLAPRLVRQLALVNATVRVNPHELKAVIEHFADVLAMQTNMAESIVHYCELHKKDLQDMKRELEALDTGSRMVESEILRNIIKRYGFKFSKNKFQTFVRLQFKTHGTKIPYDDFFKVLFTLTDALMNGQDVDTIGGISVHHHLNRHQSSHGGNSSFRKHTKLLMHTISAFQHVKEDDDRDGNNGYKDIGTPSAALDSRP